MFYNVLIDHKDEPPAFFIAISDEQLQRLVKSFLDGNEFIRIKGVIRKLKNPRRFIIYNIDKLNNGIAQTEVERNVRKSVILLPKRQIGLELFRILGSNVTDNFLMGKDWGANKITPSNSKHPGKIFISHSTEDQEIVKLFCELILEQGLKLNLETDIFNTSLDISKPKSGEDFRDRIKVELINAKAALQFISPNYKKSEICLNEMGAAWVLCDNVIPLIIGKREYDVGFIHHTTQQVLLSDKNDVLKFIDDHKGAFLPEQYNLTRLVSKIDEFVERHNSIVSGIPVKTNIPTDSFNLTQPKPKQNSLFTITERAGLFIYYENKFWSIPDKVTEFLLGADSKAINSISVEEMKTIDGFGGTYPSIYQSAIIRSRHSDKNYVIMLDKKRFLPDAKNVFDIIKRKNHKVNFRIVEANEVDNFEEDEPLQSSNGKIS